MKNHLVLTVFCALFITYTFSQEKRLTEVIVSDTVSLHYTQIKYEVRSGESGDLLGMKFPDYNFDDEEKKEEKPAPTNEEIMQLLDRANFNYSVSEHDQYTVSEAEIEPAIIVTLKNEAELKKLISLLKSQDGISGKISHVEYESIDKYYDGLFKDLYSKALSQATKMATITNNGVGQLLSVSYIKNEFESNIDYYKELMGTMPLSMFGSADLTTKNEELKMIFKFELIAK